MRKVPRAENSKQDNENLSQKSFKKDNDRPTYKASISVTVPAGNEEDLPITLDMLDCWSLKQHEEFKKKL